MSRNYPDLLQPAHQASILIVMGIGVVSFWTFLLGLYLHSIGDTLLGAIFMILAIVLYIADLRLTAVLAEKNAERDKEREFEYERIG